MENKVASTVSFRAEINLQVSKVAKIITNCVDKLIPKEVFPSDEKIKIIKWILDTYYNEVKIDRYMIKGDILIVVWNFIRYENLMLEATIINKHVIREHI